MKTTTHATLERKGASGRYTFRILVICIILMLFIYILITLFQTTGSKRITIPDQKNGNKTFVKIVKTVHVDIEGAVFKKGVYEIPEGSTVRDVLIQAGGLTLTADRTYVKQHMDLSERVKDQSMLYFPRTGENILDNGVSSTTLYRK